MTVSRTYHSPLREEQMEQTRERILEQVAELLASGSDGEVTVAAVAERAKVSVRTAYRYFPTKEALLDAFNDWMAHRLGTPATPATIAELREMPGVLFPSFERNEQMMRAARRSGAEADIRTRRKQGQVRAVIKAVAREAPEVDEVTRRKAAVMIHCVVGSDAFLTIRDHWGMSTEEAIAAVQWGVDAITEKLDSEKPRKGRK